jgi:ribokinase
VAHASSRPRVVVVGSINVDLVVRAGRLPAPGETVVGGQFQRTGGGKGANQAVAAARAGSAVTLIGAVGDDELGRSALDELAAEDVDVTRVNRDPERATGIALIVVDRAGENQIAVASGANHAVAAAEVRDRLADLSGPPGCLLASFELPDAAVLAGAAAARAAGWQVVVNPAPARPLAPELLEHHPIVTPNRHEAAQLTGLDDPGDAARQLAAATCAPVIVTLGADGALLVDRAASTVLPAPTGDVVDTTGAGDVFNGVLAGELAGGADLRAAVEHATAAATRSVGRIGARG